MAPPIAEGFPGQRMLVLPPTQARQFLANPASPRLVVTNIGYFPHAASHGRSRPVPIQQAIVLVCVDGKGWCETPSGRFGVETGDAVVLPPGYPHSYGADIERPWTLWWFHVSGPEVAAFLDGAGMNIDGPVRRPASLYQITSLISECLQWMERDQTHASLLAAAGAAWHALALLATDLARGGGLDRAIDDAAAYLRQHPQSQVRVEELAAMARLSTSYFAALFKERMGMPVLRYQTQLRMSRARELLDTTDEPISVVAERVGYIDSFYFARQFKKIHGSTPREYRAEHKG
ncbi:AraC family transcriptional regulator [Leifsonia sp. NPDC056665]|uniref:AraC family transcriptional regulator n=1 Tax=Leifsonia sp. NPDC056665 TaxID=3345901 RepID=UPI0036AB85D8